MVSLGIVGAGNWGRNHARLAVELKEEGRVDRVVVCDTDAQRLKPWEVNARTTTRIEDLVGIVDAVALATPADTHYTLARSLLASGLHVLVEKPMAIQGSDARALAALAREHGLVIMPGHIFRYHPAILEIRQRIARGFFGEVQFLATMRVARSAPRPDVGVLYSLGIHEADLYPHLLGVDYPERAAADAMAFERPEVDVVASMLLSFPTCAGFALESWISAGNRDRRLSLVGTRASAEVDYSNLQAMMVSGPASETDARRGESGDVVALNGKEPLRSEVEDFLKAVESNGRSRPIADAESGYRAVEVIESLKLTGWFTPRGGT